MWQDTIAFKAYNISKNQSIDTDHNEQYEEEFASRSRDSTISFQSHPCILSAPSKDVSTIFWTGTYHLGGVLRCTGPDEIGYPNKSCFQPKR